MTEPDGTSSKRPLGTLKRWGPLALLVLVAVIAIERGALDYVSLEMIADNRDDLVQLVADNWVLALTGYFAVYVLFIALSFPGGLILTLLGGFLFGWFIGGVVTVFAATAGAVIIFLIVRTSLGEALAERAGPRLDKLRKGFSEDALSYLLFLRLVPAFPFWLVNIAPALLGTPLPVYALATFVGIIPGTFAFAVAGAGLDSVITAQRAHFETCLAGREPAAAPECEFTVNPSALLTPELVAAFVLLGVVALIPVAARRLSARGRKEAWPKR